MQKDLTLALLLPSSTKTLSLSGAELSLVRCQALCSCQRCLHSLFPQMRI